MLKRATVGFSFLASALALVGCGDGGSESPAAPASANTGPAPASSPAATIELSELALFQGVKVVLMQDGAAAPLNAPAIAGRAGVFRAYVRTTGLPKETLRAELKMHSTTNPAVADRVHAASVKVLSSSKDSQPNSLLSFELAANELLVGDEVSLTAVGDKGTNLRYPAEGAQPVGAVQGRTVSLRLVPVRYQADGADLLPELSAADVASYRRVLEELYPLARADVSVRAETVPWTTTLKASGDGWDEMLDAIGDARIADKAETDVFYMGLFRSRSSLGEYCRGQCILGLAPVIGTVGNSSMQFALSVGFGSDETPDTIAHELGHNLGRNHAPCGGAAGPDRKYPYDAGSIGKWGYSIATKEFLDGDEYTDVMGYCRPQWISDYTYNALFKRLGLIADLAVKSRMNPGTAGSGFAASPGAVLPGVVASSQLLVRVGADGTLHWPTQAAVASAASSAALAAQGSTAIANASEVAAPAPSGTIGVQYTDARGVVLSSANAEYVPLDHLPGGYLMVPAPPRGAVDFVVPSLTSAAQLQVARPAELRRLRLPHHAPLLRTQPRAR